MAMAEDRIAKALEVMKEADLKLQKLRSLHPFLIDVSLRETSVGHHIGQTLKEKLEILPKIREFGLQNIVLGALNYSIPDELSVDDDFMLHLRDHGHDLKGCFAFTSLGIQSADGNFQPDPSQIKIKSYRIPHTIHEIFLCSENRKALYDRETLLRSLPASIRWLRDNLVRGDEPTQIFINVVDGCDAFLENPQLVFDVLTVLANESIAGFSFQDDRGTFFPFQIAAFTKIVRSFLPPSQKILVHIHSGAGFENASVVEALLNGADGAWGALPKLGPVIGHASLSELIAHLTRIENPHMQHFQLKQLIPLSNSLQGSKEDLAGFDSMHVLGTNSYRLPLSFFRQIPGRPQDLPPEKIGGQYAYRICPVVSDASVIAGRLSEVTGQSAESFSAAVLEKMQRLMRQSLRQGRRVDYDLPENLLRLFTRAEEEIK